MKLSGIFDVVLNLWMSFTLKVANFHRAPEIIGREDICRQCQCKYKMHGLNLSKATTIATFELKVAKNTI